MRRTTPHLLLVDDQHSFRELVKLQLESLGWCCTAVGAVPDAIDALERERFDLILSDHSLPGQGGLDLLAYAHRRLPEVPFVLMSGVLDEDVRAVALGVGASAVLSKDELLDALGARAPAAGVRAA